MDKMHMSVINTRLIEIIEMVAFNFRLVEVWMTFYVHGKYGAPHNVPPSDEHIVEFLPFLMRDSLDVALQAISVFWESIRSQCAPMRARVLGVLGLMLNAEEFSEAFYASSFACVATDQDANEVFNPSTHISPEERKNKLGTAGPTFDGDGNTCATTMLLLADATIQAAGKLACTDVRASLNTYRRTVQYLRGCGAPSQVYEECLNEGGRHVADTPENNDTTRAILKELDEHVERISSTQNCPGCKPQTIMANFIVFKNMTVEKLARRMAEFMKIRETTMGVAPATPQYIVRKPYNIVCTLNPFLQETLHDMLKQQLTTACHTDVVCTQTKIDGAYAHDSARGQPMCTLLQVKRGSAESRRVIGMVGNNIVVSMSALLSNMSLAVDGGIDMASMLTHCGSHAHTADPHSIVLPVAGVTHPNIPICIEVKCNPDHVLQQTRHMPNAEEAAQMGLSPTDGFAAGASHRIIDMCPETMGCFNTNWKLGIHTSDVGETERRGCHASVVRDAILDSYGVPESATYAKRREEILHEHTSHQSVTVDSMLPSSEGVAPTRGFFT
jgi:hypothetical protein